jgi:hypothetical protein
MCHVDSCHCRRSGNRGTQTCLPAAQGVAPFTGLVRPIFIIITPRPSRGAEPHEGDSVKTSRGATRQGWLPTSRDLYATPTSRGSDNVSHDDQGQAGASGRRVAVSSLVQRGQAQTQSPKESAKGFHSRATRPRPPGRQDGGHHRAHHGVRIRSFAGKDHLSSG